MHSRSRALVIVLAALLVLPLADGTHPAGAKKRFKTVTKTFTSIGSIAIPGTGSVGPADPYPVTIAVGGFKKGKIKDVNLTINGFTHAFTRDVDLLLVAPNGRDAYVMSDVGSDIPVSGLTLRLDDEAAAPLPFAPSPLTSGTYWPTNLADGAGGGVDTFNDPAPIPSGIVALTIFDGRNPNGTWQLWLRDDRSGNVGGIADGFVLEITAKVKKK